MYLPELWKGDECRKRQFYVFWFAIMEYIPNQFESVVWRYCRYLQSVVLEAHQAPVCLPYKLLRDCMNNIQSSGDDIWWRSMHMCICICIRISISICIHHYHLLLYYSQTRPLHRTRDRQISNKQVQPTKSTAQPYNSTITLLLLTTTTTTAANLSHTHYSSALLSPLPILISSLANPFPQSRLDLNLPSTPFL